MTERDKAQESGRPSVYALAHPLCWVLRSQAIRSVVLFENELVLEQRDRNVRLARADVLDVTPTRGIIWEGIRIVRRDGAGTLQVRGLSSGVAARLSGAWDVLALRSELAAAHASWRTLKDRDAYLNHRALEQWRAAASALVLHIPERIEELPLPRIITDDINAIRRVLADGERIVAERNDRYVANQKERHRSWFDTFGAHGLTDDQREAVLRDEDNCLVVAGAGTGKTTTVAAKVGFLLRTRAAGRRSILLLSFTRKAADEMRERIKATTGADVTVRTFHALGLEILGEADGKRPSLSKLAEDPLALTRALTRYVSELLGVAGSQSEVAAFFAYYLYPRRSPFEFDTAHDFYQYLSSHDLRTLCGELVKSHEELLIANWLFLNGVEYEYERKYAHDTASVQYRQYQPDFYLPKYDVWLEHFGVDRDGRTPPWVDARKYRESMQWKRILHARHNTRLIETFSYENAEGRLLDALKEKLEAAGVEIVPRPPDEVRARIREQRLDGVLSKLLLAFLSLFKGNLWTLDEIEGKARSSQDPGRALALVAVFRRILEQYEDELLAAGDIDFNDMIALATDRVEAGKYRSPFTHVIVDEFQDLSRGRARLLKALLGQVEDRRLFCVGDDWQSIYRFTGSDIAQMTHFPQEFGFTHRCDLRKTHRFGNELLQASSRFIQENPEQLRKTLVSDGHLGGPAIEAIALSDGQSTEGLLRRILGDLPAKSSVLVLSRYRHILSRLPATIVAAYPRLSLRFLTVHKAKGLEADYAVLLDVVAGQYGFPTEIVDDPVLDLVLAGRGGFPNAEERRLFYVALTRARHRCFVLTTQAGKSKFVEELEAGGYAGLVTRSKSDAVAEPRCPTCRGGVILKKGGPFGPFWACSHYPLCDTKASRCPSCKMKAFLRDGHVFRCLAPACGHTRRVCKSCNVGFLIARSSGAKQFLGCTEWRRQAASCGYTESLPSPPP